MNTFICHLTSTIICKFSSILFLNINFVTFFIKFYIVHYNIFL
nr:MAG TPA: hypothetical protein [Caudoviricetes sp.]